jgi:hypothetical protein
MKFTKREIICYHIEHREDLFLNWNNKSKMSTSHFVSSYIHPPLLIIKSGTSYGHKQPSIGPS